MRGVGDVTLEGGREAECLTKPMESVSFFQGKTFFTSVEGSCFLWGQGTPGLDDFTYKPAYMGHGAGYDRGW